MNAQLFVLEKIETTNTNAKFAWSKFLEQIGGIQPDSVPQKLLPEFVILLRGPDDLPLLGRAISFCETHHLAYRVVSIAIDYDWQHTPAA
jgi:hypothetical protein